MHLQIAIQQNIRCILGWFQVNFSKNASYYSGFQNRRCVICILVFHFLNFLCPPKKSASWIWIWRFSLLKSAPADRVGPDQPEKSLTADRAGPDQPEKSLTADKISPTGWLNLLNPVSQPASPGKIKLNKWHDNWVGGGQATADLSHHRAYRSVHGGSTNLTSDTPLGVVI